ncbi:hypothetical protein WJX73_007211 [Symbiochloris irregularis]|uniref:Uncharacterized protein n=1 Tax=Symbiochloris irregularis TaxID=706552 RepID=A0AAW1NX74_9CHLO
MIWPLTAPALVLVAVHGSSQGGLIESGTGMDSAEGWKADLAEFARDFKFAREASAGAEANAASEGQYLVRGGPALTPLQSWAGRVVRWSLRIPEPDAPFLHGHISFKTTGGLGAKCPRLSRWPAGQQGRAWWSPTRYAS